MKSHYFESRNKNGHISSWTWATRGGEEINKKKTKKLLNFPLEKYPNIPRNAFILSIFIFILSILFPIGTFGNNIEIILIPMGISWVFIAVLGLIASLVHKKLLYTYLNGLVMILFILGMVLGKLPFKIY